MNKKEKKAYEFLESIYKTYNCLDYIKTDPIRFPHELEGNKEFIAFTASAFAYGNMKALQKNLFNYFETVGTDPFNLDCQVHDKLYYRFQTKEDVASYSNLMKKIYNEYGSLENLFKAANVYSVSSIDNGMKLLRSHIENITNGLNFLLPVPGNSATKRIYMFLRWMVRKDDVDFGVWEYFDKTTLLMPADTHILRMANKLGIIGENEKGKKAVEKVTDFFRRLNPQDPAKYDFALTRLGIVLGCQYSESDKCLNCNEFSHCIFK